MSKIFENYTKTTLEIVENSSNTVVVPLEILRNLLLVAEGFQGASGDIKTLSKHAVVSEATDDPLLIIDASQGSLYHVSMSQNVAVSLINFSNSLQHSQRVTIYLQQDSEGNRIVSEWPANVLWSDGSEPQINTAAFAFTRIVFDTIDGGATLLGHWSAV